MNREAKSFYTIATMCVERNGEVVVADTDYEPYTINDALHAMITMCKAPYNGAYSIC